MAVPGGATRVVAFGDGAVLVDLGPPMGRATTELVLGLTRHLAASVAGQPGWLAPVPAATTVLVPVDPVDPGVKRAVAIVERLVASDDWRSTVVGSEDHAIVDLPVRYGGVDGPDLEDVAALAGLSAEQVVELHTGTVYTAAFMGFAPGFAYLAPLAEGLVLPRRPTPRPRVPAGSVGIGGPQTAVYPVDSPGGWWIIGRTAVRTWDPAREPPALLRPGVRVRFVPDRQS